MTHCPYCNSALDFDSYENVDFCPNCSFAIRSEEFTLDSVAVTTPKSDSKIKTEYMTALLKKYSECEQQLNELYSFITEKCALMRCEDCPRKGYEPNSSRVCTFFGQKTKILYENELLSITHHL